MVQPGQELEVDEDDVDAYLGHRSAGWTLVDDEGDATDDEDSTDESSAAEDDESSNADGEDEPEVVFDVEGFLDRNVDPIADDIEDGVADGYLDGVEEGADRKTVLDAIEARREELEAEG
jgi:hypothetical protein